jgi:hypothetical protein
MMDYENINIEMKDLPPVGGVLTPGRHAGEMSEANLGIETALAMQITDLQKELELSKANANDWSNRHSEAQTTLRDMRYNLGELLKTQIESELITNTGAKEIAELIGLDLTKTVNVSGTITFSGQIEISIFDDVDELSRYDVEADVNVSYEYDCLNSFDYDVDSVEFEEE